MPLNILWGLSAFDLVHRKAGFHRCCVQHAKISNDNVLDSGLNRRLAGKLLTLVQIKRVVNAVFSFFVNLSFYVVVANIAKGCSSIA